MRSSGPALAALLLAGGPRSRRQEATRTPTPAPRLSGGFGRPRATPVAKTPYDGGGQGYSDVVHAAHETRDGAAPADAGTVTINNQSLVKNTSKGKVSSSKAVAARAASRLRLRFRRPRSRPPTVPPWPTRLRPAGGEAQWKATAAKARKRVADDKARVAELEAATKKLENDFYAWDDGQYRDRVIKPAWDHAKSELTDAKNELARRREGPGGPAREGARGGGDARMDPRMTTSPTARRRCRPTGSRPGAAR